MEIERKFTIKQLPDNLEQYQCLSIEQGYLCTNPIVRIRQKDNEYILTYKSKQGIDTTNTTAIVNQEVEVPLTKSAYEHLREKVDHQLVTKHRYLIPLQGNLKIELDVFEGHLKGLYFAEVEFESEEAANSFEPPEWFDQDVSKDKRYSNSHLSKITSLAEF